MRSPSRVVLLLCLIAHVPLLAQAPNDTTHRAGWNWDLSSLLTGVNGVVPVPFAFGNPVVGVGGGLGLVFYHPPVLKNTDTVDMRRPPPSFGVGGFYTSKAAWGAVGGLYRPWHNDRFRYLGIVGGGEVGLHYFGVRDSPFQQNPLDYNWTPVGTLQRVQTRVFDFPLYVGAEYDFVHTRSLFDSLDRLPIELPRHDQKIDIGGLAGSLVYDTRNNFLDATEGVDLSARVAGYGRWLGSTEGFGRFNAFALGYTQPRKMWGFAGRLDLTSAWGQVPFFYVPYIDMRGLQVQKFSGRVTMLGEGEARMTVFTRWTGIAFAGIGSAATNWGEFSDARVAGAGGVGFRYLLAKKFGIRSGVDVAVGTGGKPLFYLQNGAAWK
jgi:hypothetical protein